MVYILAATRNDHCQVRVKSIIIKQINNKEELMEQLVRKRHRLILKWLAAAKAYIEEALATDFSVEQKKILVIW